MNATWHDVCEAIEACQDYVNISTSMEDLEADIHEAFEDASVTPKAFCDLLANFDLTMTRKERSTISGIVRRARSQ
jgi:hypothetical protein